MRKRTLKKNKTRKNKKSSRKNKTRKKKDIIIGMLTVPLSPNKQFYSVCGDSYISSRHETWFKNLGIKILPIPYTTKNHKEYMHKVHGLYFPSGGAFAGTQSSYYNCCKTFVKLAMKFNDIGYHFPIWGGCMGMQQLMIIADGNDDLEKLLQYFDSYNNLMCTLDFTEDGLNSRMMKKATDKEMKKFKKQKCSLNNHKMGLTPYKFKSNKNINKFYKIVSTSKDRKGRVFVSTIEGRHYPFYGVQWHPERSSEMNYFAKFFIRELKKNRNKIRKHKTKLFSKKIKCDNFSDSLYKKCNFYWHKKTSKHNKKLCSVAQIMKSEKNQEKLKKGDEKYFRGV